MTVKNWMDLVDWDSPVDEDDLWEAIAESENVDYDEIADRDLLEFI